MGVQTKPGIAALADTEERTSLSGQPGLRSKSMSETGREGGGEVEEGEGRRKKSSAFLRHEDPTQTSPCTACSEMDNFISSQTSTLWPPQL